MTGCMTKLSFNFIAILMCGLFLSGCQATIDGGKLERENTTLDKGSSYVITVTPNGLVIDGTVKFAATTQSSTAQQPTITGPADAIKSFKLGGGDFNSLGGLSVEFQKRSQSIVLGIVFLVGAALFYFLKKPMWCAVCVAGAILSFLYPEFLVWAAVIVVAYVAYLCLFNNKKSLQLIKGIDSALETLPPALREQVLLHLKGEQDAAVQKSVDSTLEPSN